MMKYAEQLNKELVYGGRGFYAEYPFLEEWIQGRLETPEFPEVERVRREIEGKKVALRERIQSLKMKLLQAQRELAEWEALNK